MGMGVFFVSSCVLYVCIYVIQQLRHLMIVNQLDYEHVMFSLQSVQVASRQRSMCFILFEVSCQLGIVSFCDMSPPIYMMILIINLLS